MDRREFFETASVATLTASTGISAPATFYPAKADSRPETLIVSVRGGEVTARAVIDRALARIEVLEAADTILVGGLNMGECACDFTLVREDLGLRVARALERERIAATRPSNL